MAYSKEKMAEYHKAYYEANKEKIAERQKAYYEANKEKRKDWCRRNRDKLNKYARDRYKRLKEEPVE